MNRILMCALGVAVGFAPSSGHSQTTASDDTLIYKVVLEGLVSPRYASKVIVKDKTRPDVGTLGCRSGPCEPVRAIKGLHSTAIADFERPEKSGVRVPVFGLPGIIVEMVEDSVFGGLGGSNGDYWGAFRTRFPGVKGIITVSGVGYSADRRQAVVAVDYICGGLCGRGRLAMLEKVEGVWKVSMGGGLFWTY